MLKCQYDVMEAECGEDAARVYVKFYEKYASEHIAAAECNNDTGKYVNTDYTTACAAANCSHSRYGVNPGGWGLDPTPDRKYVRGIRATASELILEWG